MHLRGLVGAVLAPHHRVHRQFGVGGPAAEDVADPLVLVVLEAEFAEGLGVVGGGRRVLDRVDCSSGARCHGLSLVTRHELPVIERRACGDRLAVTRSSGASDEEAIMTDIRPPRGSAPRCAAAVSVAPESDAGARTSSPTTSSATGPGQHEPVRARRYRQDRRPVGSLSDLRLELVDSATVPATPRTKSLVFLHYVGTADRSDGRPPVREPTGSAPATDRSGERHPLRPGRAARLSVAVTPATGTPAARRHTSRRRRRPSVRVPSAWPAAGAPTSTVGMPVRAEVIGPMVEPHGRSARCS